jgi:3-phenylpropionate/trans-cinnamate dioxygenase ferredoxin subunit
LKSEKPLSWHKIAEGEAELILNQNQIAEAEVAGKKICLARYQEQWFAFAWKCPHAGGMMADGYIDITGNIVCPVHRYKYNLQNGRNTSGEGFYLKTYPVQVTEEGVFVGIEKGWW